MSLEKRIVIVSDGTGETAAQMVKAGLVQFENADVHFTRYKNIRNQAQITAICEEAKQIEALVCFTIVSPELRVHLTKTAENLSLQIVDLLGPLLVNVAKFLGENPKTEAGGLHLVDDTYFRRIEAMEFTVAHDDGKDVSDLEKADLVILGISRTSKTPLSMYLSHQGWKVANVPLIPNVGVPPEVFEIDQKKVVGLLIDPEQLSIIRRARLERLGSDKGGDYADLDRVVDEIEFAKEIYQSNRVWPIFNVTGKALEETAAEIIRVMSARRLMPEQKWKKSKK